MTSRDQEIGGVMGQNEFSRSGNKSSHGSRCVLGIGKNVESCVKVSSQDQETGRVMGQGEFSRSRKKLSHGSK